MKTIFSKCCLNYKFKNSKYSTNARTLLNYNISIITACMDRLNNLLFVLESWVIAGINEIVIVDWGHNDTKLLITKINELHSKYNGIKFSLVVVKNEDLWNLTKAFNIASQFVTNDIICKLDCDILLCPDFFIVNQINKGEFITGNWKLARNKNEKHLNGNIIVYKKDFFYVHGYNEYIQSYGYDDCDLYNRLKLYLNLKHINFNNDSMKHLEHSQYERVKHSSKDNITYRLDLEIEKNRLICEKLPWDLNKQMCFYQIVSKKTSFLSKKKEFYIMTTPTIEIPKSILDECYNKALNNIFWVQLQNIKLNKLSGKPRLYINVMNGLGNRLRALASAYIIAKNTNRDLVIIWLETDHCKCKFTDLYDFKQLILNSPCDMAIGLETNIDILQILYNIKNKYNYFEDLNINWYDYKIKKDEFITDNVFGDIYVSSACRLNSLNTSFKEENEFLQLLKPVEKINNIILTYTSIYNFKNIVGVHIRMGQDSNLYSFENTTNWAEESIKSLKKWRNNSNYTIFINKMLEIIYNNPSIKFFIACDSKETYDYIINFKNENVILKNYIIFYKRTCFNRSKDQLETALIDMLLLSKCSYLLGSNWSSFTELAHRINSIPYYIASIDF